jgi:DOPA 4,5-dioxygenase
MSMPENLYGFHIHIYFDDATKGQACDMRDTLIERFKAQPSAPKFVGITGPHPIPQVVAIFPRAAFTGEVVSWLMFNRQGLAILIHPLTDDEVDDHTAHAIWLGIPVDLIMERLERAPTTQELMPVN